MKTALNSSESSVRTYRKRIVKSTVVEVQVGFQVRRYEPVSYTAPKDKKSSVR